MPTRFRLATLRLVPPLALAIAAALEPATAADTDKIAKAGDVLQFVIVGAGAGIALGTLDWEGGAQFGGSFVTTQAAVFATKAAVGRNRPGGSERTSFPSAHTSVSFSGAAFIDTRYGHWVGLPAYAAATYVGVSRVVANHHFASDVLGSVGFALLSNWAWVSPHPAWVKLTPALIGNGGYGIGISIPLGGDRDRWRPPPTPPPRGPAVWQGLVSLFDDPTPGREILLESEREGASESAGEGSPPARSRYRFAMDLGAFVPHDDSVALGRFGIPEIDLERDKASGERNMFVALRFEAAIDAQRGLSLELTSFESQATQLRAADIGAIGFDDPGQVRSNLYDVTALYGHRFDLTERLGVTPAFGLSYQYLEVEAGAEITGPDPFRRKLERNRLFPMPRVTLDYEITPTLLLSAAGSGMSYGSAWTWKADARLRWQFDPRWDVGVGYSFVGFGTDTAQLTREFVADTAFIELGYSWGQVRVPDARRERTSD